MSPFQYAFSSTLNQSFDETRWVINIQQSLDADFEDDNGIMVCIFSVPKLLISTNPDSYTPQQVAIGPYHCLRSELYEMERNKLAAARRMQKQLKTIKISNHVEKLKEMEPRIRACYHKYLEFSGETLVWMMAIDGSFLLEFLQIYNIEKGKTLTRDSSRMSHLFDNAGSKYGHNEILRDILMLENQMPLFVLRKMLEIQFASVEAADDMLISMLMELCKEVSPFKMMENSPKTLVSKYSHILDLLYQTIVPKLEELSEMMNEENEADVQVKGRTSDNSSSIGQYLKEIKIFIRKVFLSKPVRFIVRLPWRILSNVPGFTVLRISIDYLFSGQESEARKEDACSGACNNIDKPPLVEEITIPSVSELYKSGVHFVPTSGNVLSISFDFSSGELYLPIVSLDINTEVILRNLVAYEASNSSEPMVFSRYTELMNGIIDDEEDVRLLREKGIFLNRLKSDEEAANLWNGMSKSVRLTKVPLLDKVIEDVNRYYSSRWRVKIGKFVNLYVYGSWQCLAFLAAILLLLLLSLQAFSLVYSSMRLFRMRTIQ